MEKVTGIGGMFFRAEDPEPLRGFAQACKPLISRRFSLLWLAQRCTVLRSRWCQSGVKWHRFIRPWFALELGPVRARSAEAEFQANSQQ